MSLAAGLKFNKTIVKLGLANNGLKACVVKLLLESLLDNFCLAELSLAGNFLDNEFAVDLAHLLESNQTIHTVDISKNPIGPEGAKLLLQSILQHNDTLESLGDDMDSNMYMGVRMREEMKQTLNLNQSNHERKRHLMSLIENTKSTNPTEKDIPSLVDPLRKEKKIQNDKGLVMDVQLGYPLLKPIAFTNEIQDDYMISGVWNVKKAQ